MSDLGDFPTSKPIAWAVKPCGQWHKEFPGRPTYIVWTMQRFAWESSHDTDGEVIPLVPAAEWLPIEDCPEKTVVLLWIPGAKREVDRKQTGRYGITADGHRLYTIGGRFGFDVGTPTHFQLLPEDPS